MDLANEIIECLAEPDVTKQIRVISLRGKAVGYFLTNDCLDWIEKNSNVTFKVRFTD